MFQMSQAGSSYQQGLSRAEERERLEADNDGFKAVSKRNPQKNKNNGTPSKNLNKFSTQLVEVDVPLLSDDSEDEESTPLPSPTKSPRLDNYSQMQSSAPSPPVHNLVNENDLAMNSNSDQETNFIDSSQILANGFEAEILQEDQNAKLHKEFDPKKKPTTLPVWVDLPNLPLAFYPPLDQGNR